MYSVWCILYSLSISVSSQHTFLVPEQQISSAEEVIYTIIYVDFKVFILKPADLDKIATLVGKLDELLISENFPAHTSILKVYEDINEDLARLDDLNNATRMYLDEKVVKPAQTFCLFTRSILNKKVFKDLIEGFELLIKSAPAKTDLTVANQQSIVSPTSLKISRILFDAKVLLKDFFSSMENQYFHLLAVARNEIPNFISHKLNEGKCVKSTPHDKFTLIRSKFYSEGNFLTIQLTQATEIKNYLVWKPIPFADYILDCPDLITPLGSNSSFFERKCTQLLNHKKCEIIPVSTVCMTLIAENDVKNTFRECNMLRNANFEPFLSLSGIVVPRYANIYEQNLETKEKKLLQIENPNPLLSIIIRSPLTLEIENVDKSYKFGPSGFKKEVIYSGISNPDLIAFMDPLFDLKTNPEKYIILLLGNLLAIVIIASGITTVIFRTKAPEITQNFALQNKRGQVRLVTV